MVFISYSGLALLCLFAVIPSFASSVTSSKDCPDDEYWLVLYFPRSGNLMTLNRSNGHCVRKGSQSPPQGIDCPDTHYWKDGCCVSYNSHDDDSDNHPHCHEGWIWKPEARVCVPAHSTPTGPHHPVPSKHFGDGHHDGDDDNGDHDDHDSGNGHSDDDDHGGHWNDHRRKRSFVRKARLAPLCPAGLDACPISMEGGDYECIDTFRDLESCGGCASLGHGEDCTAIRGAWNVGCHRGHCVGKWFEILMLAVNRFTATW